MARQRNFIVVLEPERDGGYSVHCPALPGCVSQGESRGEALDNIRAAMLLVLQVMREEGTKIPQDSSEVVAQEIQEILKAREEDGLPLTVEATQVELPLEVAV